MQHTSLENTLHIRAYMQRHDICCHKFLPTEEMLAIFNQDIYSSSSDDYDNKVCLHFLAFSFLAQHACF